jgi:methionyl-tRNA synthetase
VPFGADGSYTEAALVLRTNVDLANDLGNLLHRTLAMIHRFADGRVELPAGVAPSRPLEHATAVAVSAVTECMDAFNLSEALAAVGQLVREANKEIERSQPWALAKQADKAPLAWVLYDLAETLRVISVLLTPFLVETPMKMRAQLGLSDPASSWEETRFGSGGTVYQVAVGEALFPRIEAEEPRSTTEEAAPTVERDEPVNYIDADLFKKVELGVGTIESAEVVDGADRLLRLRVDDGSRVRTIVSGIRVHYAPEDLIGKQVVLVKNLKPVKIRGIESEGMLLAASEGDALTLVAPAAPIAAGARVK